MASADLESMSALHEVDETAWLDAMAELIRTGRVDQLDLENLAEFLSSMGKRDRREAKSRLTVLLAHLLKWHHQPEQRSGSWRATIIHQRHELQDDASSGVLRQHLEACLAEAYERAVEQAAAETQISPSAFPASCPYTVDQLLNDDLTSEI